MKPFLNLDPSPELHRRFYPGVVIFLLAVIFTTHQVQADLGKINIRMRATIVSNTCTVSAGSLIKTVNMGTWAKKQFTETASLAPMVSFTIDLEKCGPAASGVEVSFTGMSDGNGELFKLNPTSTASGVGVAILDKERNRILPGHNSLLYPLTASAASAALQFYAQYVATGGGSEVGAGTANADATFTMEYS
ncbi:fimbrial protein [Enterobacteriaceae bacterium 8376wB9]|nr:fimbrial protein [Enterobacteriaceae bacterium 8376wB9]